MMTKLRAVSLFILFVSIILSASRAQAMDRYTVLDRSQYADYLRYSSSVSSFNYRATPYPTLTPIGTKPTSVSFNNAINTSCPVGVPAGYGTVTPSIDWLYSCSHCLPTYTPVGFYTSTPGATHTPWGYGGTALPPICITVPAGGEVCYTQTAPTGSPTVTQTPFPTSTSVAVTPTVTSAQLNMYTASLGVSGSPYISGQTGSYTSSPVLNSPGSLYVITGTVSANDGNNVIGGNVRYDFWFDPLITSGAQTIYVSWNITNVIGGTGASAYNPLGTSVASGSTTFSNQYNVNRQIFIGASSSASRNTGAFGATFQLWVSTYPYDPFATATPSPSPTPTLDPRYCASISDQMVPNQFEFGGGDVVWQSCISTPEIDLNAVITVLSGGWLAGFASLFNSYFPNAIIDPVTICVRTRDYSLYLFGYRVPVEGFIGMVIFLSSLRSLNPAMSSLGGLLGSMRDTSSNDSRNTSSKTKADN